MLVLRRQVVLARLAQGVGEELLGADRRSADDSGDVGRDGAVVGPELLFDACEEPGVGQDDPGMEPSNFTEFSSDTLGGP